MAKPETGRGAGPGPFLVLAALAATGTAVTLLALPDARAAAIPSAAVAAIAFLYGVRAFVKPPRTGAEED